MSHVNQPPTTKSILTVLRDAKFDYDATFGNYMLINPNELSIVGTNAPKEISIVNIADDGFSSSFEDGLIIHQIDGAEGAHNSVSAYALPDGRRFYFGIRD